MNLSSALKPSDSASPNASPFCCGYPLSVKFSAPNEALPSAPRHCCGLFRTRRDHYLWAGKQPKVKLCSWVKRPALVLQASGNLNMLENGPPDSRKAVKRLGEECFCSMISYCVTFRLRGRDGSHYSIGIGGSQHRSSLYLFKVAMCLPLLGFELCVQNPGMK